MLSKWLFGLALAGALAFAGGTALAGDVTEANVSEKMASAASPADYDALVQYFTAQANAAAAKVKEHERMAASAKAPSGGGGKPAVQIGSHCDSLVSAYKKTQADYEALAKEYAAAAKGGK
jgi:hypothetical protein